MENKNNSIQLPIGIWYIDDKMACRKNVKTNKIVKIPITDEILEQIQKQNVAEKELCKLLKVFNSDNTIIGKLWAFLDEYINYISYDSKMNLISKMKEIAMSDWIDVNNSDFINCLCLHLDSNNMESFCDTLEQFFDFNLQYIREMVPMDSSLLSSVLNIQEPDFS